MECDPRGIGAQAARCDQVGVRKYPTWVIAGRIYEGVQSLDDLAKASGFQAPSSP